MTSPLALAILALSAVTPARAVELAGHFEAASAAERVGAHVLVALAYHESGFRHRAVSPCGARGLLQLHPKWWPTPRDERRHVLVAARVLKLYERRCKTMVRALGGYRSGRCVAGPRARATWRLAGMVRQRMERPSANRLRAPVLR